MERQFLALDNPHPTVQFISLECKVRSVSYETTPWAMQVACPIALVN
jgi:hypothetical protein